MTISMAAYSSWTLICCLSLIVTSSCSPTDSILLKLLRTHRSIQFQATFSSPPENLIVENSTLELTCSFLSNFDKIDVHWFHNGTLVESFVSQALPEQTNETAAEPFLAASIVSTIHIEAVSLSAAGAYQCVGVHQHGYEQQTFRVHVNSNQGNATFKNTSTASFITVHTSQALFEPRNSMSLMCRFSSGQKDLCRSQWFDPNDHPLKSLDQTTDLILHNATFDSAMGFYVCQICCSDQCQKLATFVYPAGEDQ